MSSQVGAGQLMANAAVSAAIISIDFLLMLTDCVAESCFYIFFSNSAVSSFCYKKQIEDSSPHVPVRISDEPI